MTAFDKLGDVEKRGYLMEAATAATLLTAGADVLVMRHPKAMELTRKLMAEMGL